MASLFSSFAIVPAAGRSRRMGRPKLRIDVGGRPLIDHVLHAWTVSRAARVVVVARSSDAWLHDRCRRFPVDVVTAERDPPDMRASIELGLRHVETRYRPMAADCWLTAPADLPALSAALIDAVLQAFDPPAQALCAPVVGGRMGHPLALSWAMVDHVRSLAEGVGLNAVVAAQQVRPVPWPDEQILQDLDTPADFHRLRRRAIA